VLARRFPEDARRAAQRWAEREEAALATVAIIGALRAGVLGDESQDVAFLDTQLSSSQAPLRRAALGALAELGSEAGIESVRFALADEEPEVRLAAVRALGKLKSPDGRSSGADKLVELVGVSQDEPLVAASLRAIADAAHPRAADVIGPFVHATSPVIAVAAVDAMGALPLGASTEWLLEASRSSEPEVVKAALLALERTGETAAWERIGEILSHPGWDVRCVAADCLGRSGGRAAFETLASRLAVEREPIVREAIDRALATVSVFTTVRRSPTILPARGDA
jgi:HEAT repeat protein